MFSWFKSVLNELVEIKKLLEKIERNTHELASTVNKSNHRGRSSITTNHWND